MLSLNASWLAAMSKASVEPRFLATLHVATATSYQFLSGKCDSITAPESIIDVVPVGREIDMVTRDVRTQSMSLRLTRDPLIESIIKTYGVLGARLVLEWGDASLSEANFETMGAYSVRSPVVHPAFIELPCATADDLLEAKVTGYWFAQHFLEIIEDIIDKAGVPSGLVDSTSFDPTQYGTTMSHLNTSRATIVNGGASLSINEPTPARELVDELALILGGSVAAGDDGILRFAEFDSSAAAVASWTADDYGDDIEFGPTVENLINKVTVTTHPRTSREGALARGMVGDLAVSVSDDNSIDTNYATIVPGGANVSNVQEHKIESPWINAFGYLVTDISAPPTTGETLRVQGFETHSFTGARWPTFPSGSQPPTAALSAARPAYFKLGNEIIRCETGAATSTQFIARRITFVEEGCGLDGTAISGEINVVNSMDYTVTARSQLGTTGTAHAGTTDDIFVYDVTAQHYIANLKVTRHSDGAPVCRLRTGLSEFAVEVNDLVTLTVPWMMTRTIDQVDSNTKWEVLGKQVDLYGGRPGINWVLGYATTSSPPVMSKSYDFRRQAGIAANLDARAAAAEDVGENHVVSGLGVTDGGTLDAVVAAGVAYGNASRSVLAASQTITLTADRDCYIYWDHPASALVWIETTLGAGQPTTPPAHIPLAKVVTSSGPDDIDSITDLQPTKALNGGKLVDATVDTTQIAATAVTTAKIAADAVTATEVADDSLGAVNFNTEHQQSMSIAPDPSFSLYTRG